MLGRMHPRTNSSIRIGTSAHKHATFPSPRICSLYLSVETRRMQPLNGRFPSGAAGFRLFGPPRLRTHFPSVRREEPNYNKRPETNSRYRFHFVKGRSPWTNSIRDLPFPAARITYSSLLLIPVILRPGYEKPPWPIDSSYCPTLSPFLALPRKRRYVTRSQRFPLEDIDVS